MFAPKVLLYLNLFDLYLLYNPRVSNSNVSEGQISQKKCSAGHSLWEKNFCGSQVVTRKSFSHLTTYKKSSMNKLNSITIYFVSCWHVRGPLKCTWWAARGPRSACLRPLVLSTCMYVVFSICIDQLFSPFFAQRTS